MSMFGNIFVIVFLSYYTLHILTMIFLKKTRKQIQQANTRLDELRKVSFKSLDEQKEFINIRYPKRGKFKWSWKMIPSILSRMLLFIGCMYFYNWIFFLIGLDIRLWQALLFVIIFPIILNLVLEKFKIQKTDLRTFLRI